LPNSARRDLEKWTPVFGKDHVQLKFREIPHCESGPACGARLVDPVANTSLQAFSLAALGIHQPMTGFARNPGPTSNRQSGVSSGNDNQITGRIFESLADMRDGHESIR
jgi:hypothetical protein